MLLIDILDIVKYSRNNKLFWWTRMIRNQIKINSRPEQWSSYRKFLLSLSYFSIKEGGAYWTNSQGRNCQKHKNTYREERTSQCQKSSRLCSNFFLLSRGGDNGPFFFPRSESDDYYNLPYHFTITFDIIDFLLMGLVVCEVLTKTDLTIRQLANCIH